MTPFKKEFAKRLKEKRKASGLTQMDLATKLGITSAGVSRWERGDGMPTSENLESLASALNTTSDYLVNGDPSPNGDSGVEAAPAVEPLVESVEDDEGLGEILLEARQRVAARLSLPLAMIRLEMDLVFPHGVTEG